MINESYLGNKYHYACAIQCSQEISWTNGSRSRNISGAFHLEKFCDHIAWVMRHDSFCIQYEPKEWNQKKRMIEFLALASSSLLKLGQENVHTSPNRESIYLLLGDIVKSSKVWIACYYITNHYVTKHDVMISLVNYVTDTIT